jgi:hypothetical protein
MNKRILIGVLFVFGVLTLALSVSLIYRGVMVETSWNGLPGDAGLAFGLWFWGFVPIAIAVALWNTTTLSRRWSLGDWIFPVVFSVVGLVFFFLA